MAEEGARRWRWGRSGPTVPGRPLSPPPWPAGAWRSAGLLHTRRRGFGQLHRPELSLSPDPSLPSGRGPPGPDSGPLASPASMPAPSPTRRGVGQSHQCPRSGPSQTLLVLCFLRQPQAGPDCGQQHGGPPAVYSLTPKPVTMRPHMATGPCPWAHIKDPGMRR